MVFSIPSSSMPTPDNAKFARLTPPTTPQSNRYYSIKKASPKPHGKQSSMLVRQETAPIPETPQSQRNSPHRSSTLRRCHTAPEEENMSQEKPKTNHLKEKADQKWVDENWKDLSRYYEAVGRNIDKTIKTFYRHESIQLTQDFDGNYDLTELWTKDFIRLRVICLSIATKRHHGKPLLDRIRAYNEKKRAREQKNVTIDSDHINYKKARRRIVKEYDS